MKTKILTLLRESNDYISGQQLCEQFGVTRAAVWKAINQLKKEGYEIDAVQNRGYRLLTAGIYGKNEIVSSLHTSWAGKEVKFLEAVDSTNALAKHASENGAPHGALFVADRQTAGRGRRGRAWDSPAGVNIYFSLICKPDFLPNKASMLTLVMAHAVAKAIRTVTGLEAMIKWPNDIVVQGKKVCGILTEMSAEQDYIHYVVIGVGINVGKQEFDGDIIEKATSLEQEGDKPVDRSKLLVNIMEQFEIDYQCFLEHQNLSALVDSYQSMLINQEKEVRVLDPKGEWEGIAKGITQTGELIVLDQAGNEIEVYAGEVSVRGLYGYV